MLSKQVRGPDGALRILLQRASPYSIRTAGMNLGGCWVCCLTDAFHNGLPLSEQASDVVDTMQHFLALGAVGDEGLIG